MTVREIQGHLAELYATDVSPDLISRVTDAVLDEVREWQNRPLDLVYPVVFFDALRVKIRDEGLVKNKAVYVALALNPDGENVLGLWIEQAEGAKSHLPTRSSPAMRLPVFTNERLEFVGRRARNALEHREAFESVETHPPLAEYRLLGQNQGPLDPQSND
jgi:hypothetical protein